MKATHKWFCHPQHGYMLRIEDDPVWDTVITALLANNKACEDDAQRWEKQKHRLAVNGGCGNIAMEQRKRNDRNVAFVAVAVDVVPAHIRAAFVAAYGE